MDTNNTTIKQLLNEWKISASENSIAHIKACKQFKYLNHSLMITSLLLSCVSNASSLMISSNVTNISCVHNSNWVIFSLNIVGLVSACIISIHRFLNLAELQKEHDIFGDLYEILAKDIDLHVAIDIENDTNGRMFVSIIEFSKHCKSRLDMYIDKAPVLPGKTKGHCNNVIVR